MKIGHSLFFRLALSCFIAPLCVAPPSAIAEEGCPSYFLPIGGGYCRSVECTPNTMHDYPDMNLSVKAEKLGWKCPGNFGQIPFVRWGNQTIPMR